MKLPGYLKRSRHGVYYFRVVGSRVSSQERPKKPEFSVSLRTTNRQVAATVSRQLTARLINVLPILRTVMLNGEEGATAMVNDVRQRVSGWVGQLRIGGVEFAIEANAHDPVDVASARQTLDDALRAALERLPPMPAPGAGAVANTLAPGLAVHFASVPQYPPIQETIERSLALNAATRGDKTRSEYRSYYDDFAEWLNKRGITRLAQVSPEVMSDYKAYLLNIKEVRPRKKDAPARKGLAPKTFNKQWTCLGVLFKDAKGAGHYPRSEPSPTAGHLFKKKAVARSVKSWVELTPDDLTTLFDPEVFAKWRKPHEYWVPLIILHHGLRIGEGSQLSTTDIRLENDFWILSVNEEAEGTSVKTAATARKVPLHPALIELGLLTYIADVRRLVGDGFLFPYLRPDSKNGMGKVPGATLNGYMALRLKHPRKRAHSFRKTANERLNQGLIGEEHRCQFIGHEHDTTNSTIYRNPLALETLASIVFPLLQFPIDYDRLTYKPGRFDNAIKAEMRRRHRQLAHKAARSGQAATAPR